MILASTKKKTKKKKKRSNSGTYRGIDWDSHEELYFLYWCFELKDHGYIRNIERSRSYLLSDNISNDWIKQLKTKSKPMNQTLMKGHVYTPDITITWDEKAHSLFWKMDSKTKNDKIFIAQCNKSDEFYQSIVEIKPEFDYKNMERAAKINIKWVYKHCGDYINIIKCPVLFKNTFTPKKYLLTPTGLKRKIKWNIKLIDKWIKQNKNLV